MVVGRRAKEGGEGEGGLVAVEGEEETVDREDKGVGATTDLGGWEMFLPLVD